MMPVTSEPNPRDAESGVMDRVQVDSVGTADTVARLFEAHGARAAHARLVADHLVESERLHLPSHGLVRVRQYLQEIEEGQLVADALPSGADGSGTIVQIDGHLGFGQVSGVAAADAAVKKATEYGTAFVSVRNVQHTGRLGAYTERVARRGFVAMAFAAGAPRFHRVVPFGGREGRLSTNPIAWAAPMQDGVISADFSTSATPEGRIRLLNSAGEPAPPIQSATQQGLPLRTRASSTEGRMVIRRLVVSCRSEARASVTRVMRSAFSASAWPR